MSGRIYDTGINPKCDKCGSKMWTSSERNFNGCKCKKTNCDGNPIYEDFGNSKPISIKEIDGKYIIEGVFTTFGNKKL
jgi:hypothetical protein